MWRWKVKVRNRGENRGKSNVKVKADWKDQISSKASVLKLGSPAPTRLNVKTGKTGQVPKQSGSYSVMDRIIYPILKQFTHSLTEIRAQ